MIPAQRSLAQPAEQRRDRRMHKPALDVIIGEDRFETANWSFGGFLLTGFRFPHHRSWRVRDGIAGLIGHGVETYPFHGEIARVDREERLIAVHFFGLGDDVLGLFDRRLREAMSGRASTAKPDMQNGRV